MARKNTGNSLKKHQLSVKDVITVWVLAEIHPPRSALTFFHCVAATIEDRNQAKLKLECIAFGEGTVEHIDGMAKSDLF